MEHLPCVDLFCLAILVLLLALQIQIIEQSSALRAVESELAKLTEDQSGDQARMQTLSTKLEGIMARTNQLFREAEAIKMQGNKINQLTTKIARIDDEERINGAALAGL